MTIAYYPTDKKTMNTTSRQHLLRITLFLLVSFAQNVAWATTEIFSPTTAETDLIPVLISNNRSKGYAIKINAASEYSGKAINSGSCGYQENEVWYLVGSPEAFKMYNHTAGMNLALSLDGDGPNAVATLSDEGTVLCLTLQNEGSYTISPQSNITQSFNMHGGNGQDIKLYDAADSGSRWNFQVIDMSKSLRLHYKAKLKGSYEQNYKIGELAITIDGITSTIMLDKYNLQHWNRVGMPWMDNED